ncbi:MAG: adenylate/guanylate cyclase domain-containing protein [Ilumatobacter sp.]
MGESRAGEVIDGIPTGTVTFFFTDVEGSTRLWEDHPTDMANALGRHDEIVRGRIEHNNGYVFSLAGDQFVAAFHDVESAVTAAIETQAAIDVEPWPTDAPIRVRIGIHVGVAEERDNDYFGQVLNRTARIVSAAHGEQTLLSGAAAALADGSLLSDLGEHRLKDLAEAEHLWQVGHRQHRPLRTLQTGRHNLPVERTALVGRSADITAVAKTVLDNRLVSLLGIGGTGKTRLAMAVAAEIGDRFVDGTWFVDLVPATDLNSVVEAVASAAGLRLTGTDLLDALASQAEQRHMLLVIDNCEHLTDDAADVIDLLLERSSNVHVIATSREPLDLPDEHQVRIAPLAVSPTAASPAVRLFMSTAERVGAELQSDDIEVIADICNKLDGLPLSIELAAAQLRQLRLGELAARLDRRFELLTRGRGNRRRRRQASLLDVLNDSWQMLEDGERNLLMQLAAFPSSFDLVDVEALANDTARPAQHLGGLIDRGLVSGDGHGRSRLLETVKLFVRERWADSPDVAGHTIDPGSFLDAHTGWMLAHLREHGAANNYQSVELAGWVIRHYDDHRAVEDRLAASGRLDELAALIGGLRWAYSRETGQRATAFIERVESYHESLTLSGHQSAALHLAAAGAARAARNRHWLAHGAHEAVRLFREEPPCEEFVVALIVASFTEVLRDPKQAFANLDEARFVAHEVGAETLIDNILAYRAHYAAMIGSIDEVHEVLAELEPRLVGRPVDNTTMMTLQAKMVANLFSAPEVAREAARQGATTASTFGLDNDWWVHLYLATGAAACGDSNAMRRHLADGEEMLQQSGTNGLPDLLLPYVALARVTGDLDRSRRWITGVRHADSRPGTGVVIALYRHLRAEVGLNDTNPLGEASIEDLHAEARSWAGAITRDLD